MTAERFRSTGLGGAMSLALALIAPAPAIAQHEGHGPSPAGAVWTSSYKGLSHPTSTRNVEAQRLFDQGLLLVYAFNHDAAIDCFRKAASVDPGFAMAYWGIALAESANINSPITAERAERAYAALLRAEALASRAGFRDRAYIEALRSRYVADPGAPRGPLDAAYAQAMRALFERYPDDPDAATLYADALMNLTPWFYWDKDGAPRPDTPTILAALEAAMSRDPQHVGANHYYIHALEASPQPWRAMASAARLSDLGLDTGHLAHMPSHIHLRTGDYDAMVRDNEIAVRADLAFFETTGVRDGAYPGYFAHNLEFLVVGNGFRGAYGQAMSAAEKFERVIDGVVARAPHAEHKYTRRMSVPLWFGRWTEVLAIPEPPANRPVSTAFWRYARGIAFAALGDVQAASGERAAFVAAREAIPAGRRVSNNTADELMTIAQELLDGRIAFAEGDVDGGLGLLEQAVAHYDALAYDEPPNWYYPARETLGALLLRAERPADAERVFRADLERNPRNPRSLFGLARSLEAQRRGEEAELVDAQFSRVWAQADTTLDLSRF